MPCTSQRRAAALGTALLLSVGLSACSSGTEESNLPSSVTATVPSSSETSPASAGASASPTVRTLAITVNGKNVTPAPARVKIAPGETLRLVVTADHDDELHAHGFDVEKKLTAGQPTTIDLATDEPGLYEVETHHPELRLLQVQVG